MQRSLILLGIVFLPVAVFSKERPELDSTMQQLFHSLVNLQIMAVTPEKFSSQENLEIVKRDLDVLAKAKHSFTTKPKSEEPGMMSVLSLFHDYVKETKGSLTHGNVEYARHRVRTLGNFCLSCHSRTPSGSDFEDVGSRVGNLQLQDFEKARLYAATRQFDKAIGAFRIYLLKPPKTELDFMNYTRTLREYVRLMVRVKQDPGMTLKTLQTLAKLKQLPEFHQRMIHNWQTDAEFWVKDNVVSSDLLPEALLKRAESLVKRAETLHAYPADENGDVSYLRASGYLHELLERDAKSKLRGEALYLLGITYGSLQEPFLWDLDKLFFEQCVREFPHTELSQRCYQQYAKSIYFGYSGSGGMFIPDDVMGKLKELRGISDSK